MVYLYGDQASEMVCRVKRHARHYQSQHGQGGGGGGEPDGGDDPHGDNDNGRNEQPDNGCSGGSPPSGNRNDPFLGRGGQPPRGPPGPPGGPPSNSSAHQSNSSNHPSEVGRRSENNNNNNRECPNYLRGYTPGNNRYIELAMRRYSQHIDEQVGEEPDGPLGPEVKAMNPPKPEKYVGKDDIDKFNEWLVQLLAYFRIFKIMGLCTDATHVQYTGLYLSGLAQQWYSQEVLVPTRHI